MAKSKHRPKHKKALQGYQQLRQDALAAYAATQPREVAKGMWSLWKAPEHDGESYIVGVDPGAPEGDKTMAQAQEDLDYFSVRRTPGMAHGE